MASKIIDYGAQATCPEGHTHDLGPDEMFLGLWYCSTCEVCYSSKLWKVLVRYIPERVSRPPKEAPLL